MDHFSNVEYVKYHSISTNYRIIHTHVLCCVCVRVWAQAFDFLVKQARICQSTKGGKHEDDVKCGLMQLKKKECGSVKQDVFDLSYEESSSELEKASRIQVLEERYAICTFMYLYMCTHTYLHIRVP